MTRKQAAAQQQTEGEYAKIRSERTKPALKSSLKNEYMQEGEEGGRGNVGLGGGRKAVCFATSTKQNCPGNEGVGRPAEGE